MYQLILQFINVGVNQVTGTQASKIKITNITSLIACIVAVLYALYFQLQLGSSVAASLNLMFAIIYCSPLLLSYRQFFRASKITIFIAVMSHAFVLSTYIFTSASGFHFYYLLLPSCLFLMFDDKEKFEKLLLMGLGLTLFFLCENYDNVAPLVSISATAEKIIFSSTILVVMSEIYLITYIFSNAITRNEQLLHKMAAKDWLTGLNNRGMFVEIAQKLIKHALRYDKPLSVLMLDIDYFKKINDTHGHIVGDQVLKKIAHTLQTGIRGSDTLARYGGEEFVIILPETEGVDAFEFAQNLRKSIEITPVLIEKNQTIPCSVSVGVAQIEAKIDNLDELIRCADIAMYKAKESGRNKVNIYVSDTGNS
jgi:diguanylate cyclase (GGDEF)-like protein